MARRMNILGSILIVVLAPLAAGGCSGDQADTAEVEAAAGEAAGDAAENVAGEAPASDPIVESPSAAAEGRPGVEPSVAEGAASGMEGSVRGEYTAPNREEVARILEDAPEMSRPELPAGSDRTEPPPLDLVDMNGNQFTLADLRGQVVLLAFWATWCKPCLMEVPHLVHLTEAYEAAGLRVLGVSVDRGGLPTVKRFLERRPQINYTIVPNGVPASMAFGGIRSIPTAFLIDRRGRIIRAFVGLQPPQLLESYIQAALLESA